MSPWLWYENTNLVQQLHLLDMHGRYHDSTHGDGDDNSTRCDGRAIEYRVHLPELFLRARPEQWGGAGQFGHQFRSHGARSRCQSNKCV